MVVDGLVDGRRSRGSENTTNKAIRINYSAVEQPNTERESGLGYNSSNAHLRTGKRPVGWLRYQESSGLVMVAPGLMYPKVCLAIVIYDDCNSAEEDADRRTASTVTYVDYPEGWSTASELRVGTW